MNKTDAIDLAVFMERARKRADAVAELTTSDGTRYVLRTEPSAELLEELEEWQEDGTRRLLERKFAPSQDPPSTYPRDLPFASRHRVTVRMAETERYLTAIWEDVEDVESLTNDVAESSERAGWIETAQPAMPLHQGAALLTALQGKVTVIVRWFQRGTENRMLQATARHGRPGVVTLTQMPQS